MSECTGCGQCCLSEKCQAAAIVFGDKDEICPFLFLAAPGFYRCRLLQWEEISGLKPLIKNALAAGKGCTNEAKRMVEKGTA